MNRKDVRKIFICKIKIYNLEWLRSIGIQLWRLEVAMNFHYFDYHFQFWIQFVYTFTCTVCEEEQRVRKKRFNWENDNPRLHLDRASWGRMPPVKIKYNSLQWWIGGINILSFFLNEEVPRDVEEKRGKNLWPHGFNKIPEEVMPLTENK